MLVKEVMVAAVIACIIEGFWQDAVYSNNDLC